jgi:hypothetical protein
MSYEPILEDQLADLVPTQELRLCRILPTGSLYARRDKKGEVTFTWRWMLNGKNERETIGLWDRDINTTRIARSDKGWSCRGAIRAAEAMAQDNETNKELGGFRAVNDAMLRDEQREREALEHQSLGNLMTDYANYLDSRTPGAGRDIRGAVATHVEQAFPAIYNKPATAVIADDIIKILAKINHGGYRVLSRKLRAGMRAAYATALKAPVQPDIPRAFLIYKIYMNPVAMVGAPQPPKGRDKAPIKALDLAGMRAYWDILNEKEGGKDDFQRQVLKLHLLTGAQRPAQLMRLLTKNITDTHITIYDTKGKGAAVRLQPIPLTDLARKALMACNPQQTYALSTCGGFKPIDKITPGKWAKAIVGDRIPGFQLKLVRSGVESVLAEWEMNKEHRGRLQSHGVAGVQDAHYNAFEYMAPKLGLLEVLEAILTRVLVNPPVAELVQEVRMLKAQQRELQAA